MIILEDETCCSNFFLKSVRSFSLEIVFYSLVIKYLSVALVVDVVLLPLIVDADVPLLACQAAADRPVRPGQLTATAMPAATSLISVRPLAASSVSQLDCIRPLTSLGRSSRMFAHEILFNYNLQSGDVGLA